MPALNTRGLDRFCEALEAASGLSYSAEKTYLFDARLKAIVERHGIGDYDALVSLFSRDPQARQAIIAALVTSETFFFRDEETFKALPALAASFPASRAEPLVIWSLGCATGQEAYSILMALDEAGRPPLSAVRLVGADISAAVLDRARAGFYSPFEIQRGLSPARHARYMQPVPGGFEVVPALRAVPEWLALNMLDGFDRLPRPHLIFCRNLMIYFSDRTKQRLMAAMLARLPEEGLVVLGSSESAMPYAGLIEPMPGLQGSLYRRRKP